MHGILPLIAAPAAGSFALSTLPPSRRGNPILTDEPALQKSPTGHVYWKDELVEHYSFPSDAEGRECERKAAQELVRRCKALELNGILLNARTVLHEDCYQAPVGTKWKDILPQYYAFFENPKTGTLVGIFYRFSRPSAPSSVFAVERLSDKVIVTELVGACEAFRCFCDAGLRSMGVSRSYAVTAANLERLGVSPERLVQELNGTSHGPRY